MRPAPLEPCAGEENGEAGLGGDALMARDLRFGLPVRRRVRSGSFRPSIADPGMVCRCGAENRSHDVGNYRVLQRRRRHGPGGVPGGGTLPREGDLEGPVSSGTFR